MVMGIVVKLRAAGSNRSMSCFGRGSKILMQLHVQNYMPILYVEMVMDLDETLQPQGGRYCRKRFVGSISVTCIVRGGTIELPENV